METSDPTINVENPCQACGACCSYSSNWPRFTTEEDATLDLIPEKFVNERLSGMRCDGERCLALSGRIGVAVSCRIYAVRPEVCRTCMHRSCTTRRPRSGQDLCRAARSLPDLHARRYRMRNGEKKAWPAGAGVDLWNRPEPTGNQAIKLRRYGLRQFFVVELVLDRRKGAERFGREG